MKKNLKVVLALTIVFIVGIIAIGIYIDRQGNTPKSENSLNVNANVTLEANSINANNIANNNINTNGNVNINNINTNENVNKNNININGTNGNIVEEKTIYPIHKEFSYGESENGRDLICHSIEPTNGYKKTILLVFAIHGYEDAYNKDGQVLVDTAEYLIKNYKSKSEDLLNNTRVLIVPCANPDGLYDGHTNNGYGRCNANGVDLNRDFSANHKVFTSDRNKTLKPFSAKESRALSELVEDYNPACVLDLHGWLNYTIGDGEIAKIFTKHMGLNHKTEFNNNCNGYFSYWAHTKGAKALLVEFKNTNIEKTKLVNAINTITKEI